MTYFAALDLSLTSAGGVAAPAGWGGDFRLLETGWWGIEKPRSGTLLEQQQKMAELASDIADWVFWLSDGDPKKFRLFAEAIGTGSGMFNVHELIQLRQQLQSHLTPFGIVVEPLALSSCRATLLGTIPRGPKGSGVAKKSAIATVQAMVKQARCPDPFECDDQREAFVVLNHGLSLVGGERFFHLPPKPRDARKRTGSVELPVTSELTPLEVLVDGRSAAGAAANASRPSASSAETPPASMRSTSDGSRTMPEPASRSEIRASAPSASSTPGPSLDDSNVF